MPIKVMRVLEYTYPTYEDYMLDKQNWFCPTMGTRVPNNYTEIRSTMFEPVQTPVEEGD